MKVVNVFETYAPGILCSAPRTVTIFTTILGMVTS